MLDMSTNRLDYKPLRSTLVCDSPLCLVHTWYRRGKALRRSTVSCGPGTSWQEGTDSAHMPAKYKHFLNTQNCPPKALKV